MTNTWADGPFNPSQKLPLNEAAPTECPNCGGFEKRARAKGSSGHFAKFTMNGVTHEAPDIWIAGRSNRYKLPAKDAYLAACKEWADGCLIEIEMEKKRSLREDAEFSALPTNIKFTNRNREDGGSFKCDPSDAKRVAYLKKELATYREEEPKADWHAETQGTKSGGWHRMDW